MQIQVSGKQVEVGQALTAYVEQRLSASIPKYLDRVTHVDVVLSKEAHNFRVDINLSPGTHGHLAVKARGDAADAHAAFDVAADKVEKQLRRYKRKLNDHRAEEATHRATKYVISQPEEVVEDSPLIIAEKETAIQSLTVSEAVMRMDLEDLPALVFFNKANGRLNTVYRRADGNISWVDPAKLAA